jgi:hypothetical protein
MNGTLSWLEELAAAEGSPGGLKADPAMVGVLRAERLSIDEDISD